MRSHRMNGGSHSLANHSRTALAYSLIPVPCIPEANPSRPISSSSKPPPLHPHPAYTVCGAQMTKAAKFFKKRAARAKGTGLMHFLVNAPDVAAEASISRRRPPTQRRIDKATALLHREGGQPPAPEDAIPESYKNWEREQERKSRRKAS